MGSRHARKLGQAARGQSGAEEIAPSLSTPPNVICLVTVLTVIALGFDLQQVERPSDHSQQSSLRGTMDPVELTDLPPQACQHPFVHNHEGFQVRVTRKGSKQQAYSRMDVFELDQHLAAAAASATGHAEADSAFYAAQLVHYGLPSDLHRERAMRTLRELITRKGGRPSIPVPTTIRRIENQLKKQYESLMAKERVLQALSAKATELEGELAVERQTLADLQRRVQEVAEIIRGKEETLEQKKREISDLQNDRHFANADPPKHEGQSGGEEAEQDSEESESDIPVKPLQKRKAFRAEDHLPDTCRGYKSPRLLTPPLTRTGARESYGAAVTRHDMTIDATERTYNAREDVTLRKQGPTERGREYALYPHRWESNPPSAHSSEEVRRRELLKLASGTWRICPNLKASASSRPNPKYSLALGKVFQRGQPDLPQSSSMYIKRHLLFFQFPGFTGCACSTGKAELSGGSLEITFAWRAVTGPEYDSGLADKRVFKIYLNEDEIEGYLYGSSVYPDGFVFHGTPSSSLRPWQTPESWQNTYDSLKSPMRKRHLFNTYSTRSRRFEDSSNMQANNNQRRWSVGSDARPYGRR